MASAAPTSTFFGSHPRRAQVPPNRLESTIATCHPASRQRDATAEAADPVPIAITSNVLVIVPPWHFAFEAVECGAEHFLEDSYIRNVFILRPLRIQVVDAELVCECLYKAFFIYGNRP